MSTVLAVVALVVLGGLVFVSIMRQRETAGAEKREAKQRARTGVAQLERSMSRRAEARSAPAPTAAPDAEPPSAGTTLPD